MADVAHRRPVAVGAQPARVLATARTADGQPVRRRPVPGRAWRVRCCSTPTAPPARGRSPARSRCCSCRTRCSARSPARCWTAGTGGWCWSAPTSAGWCWSLGVGALLAVGRERPADPVRRVDRQRLHPVRLVGSVGGAAARGAARAGGDDERGRHRHRRRRRRSSGAIFMLLPRWLFGADDTGAATVIFIVTVPVLLALLLSVRFPPHILGPARQHAGDPRLGGLRGGHRVAARRAHGGRACRPWRPRCPGWPRTGWCSASTRCWCW